LLSIEDSNSNYPPFLAKAHKHCTQFFFPPKRKASNLMFNLIKVMISRLASIGLGMVETKVSQHKGLTVFGKL